MHDSPTPTPATRPAPPSGLRAALALSGSSLIACAAVRTHVLLSGSEFSPRAFAAGALLLGLAAGALRPARTREGQRHALLGSLLAGLLFAFVLPALLAHLSGIVAVLVTSSALFLLAALQGRAGTLESDSQGARSCLTPVFVGTGLGLLAASFGLLPWAGTTLTTLLGAVLGLAAWPTGSSRAVMDAEAATTTPASLAAAAIAGLLAAAACGLATGQFVAPWPLAGVVAGVFAFAAVLGLRCTGKLAILAVPAVAFMFFLEFSPHWLGDLIAARIVSATLPAVGVRGGALTLLLIALFFGGVFGLLGGICLAMSRRTATTLLSAGTGLAIAGLLAAFMIRPNVEASGTDLTDRRHVVTLGSQELATMDIAHRRDELLAGHLAALLPPNPRRILVVSSLGGGALDALAAHGIADVSVAEPDAGLRRAFASLRPMQGPGTTPTTPTSAMAVAPASVSSSPLALNAAPASLDALIVQVDDPTRPEFAAWFTPQAIEAARAALNPGGAFLQRLRADRLGPEGLLRHVKLVKASFPATWIATADMARTGSVLVVALAGDPAGDASMGARLPWSRLVISPDTNPLMSTRVLTSLHEALVVHSSDLLECFVAGPAEVDLLSEGHPEFDPWRPRGEALRFPAPQAAALAFARAELFGHLGRFELELDVEGLPLRGPYTQSWPLVGAESRLPDEFDRITGKVRYENRFVPYEGELGNYRESQSRLIFARNGGTITLTELPLSQGSDVALRTSIQGLWSDDVKRSGEALVHGHRALWILVEPSRDLQAIRMTWHCPVQGRLFAAEYELKDGKPGLPEEPLGFLATHLRCHHPGETPAPPG